MKKWAIPFFAFILLLFGCNSGNNINDNSINETSISQNWAIALHGGAGGNAKGISQEKILEYEKELIKALELGVELIESGESALDVAQQVVVFLEDSPLFNAGKGAVKTYDGFYELDAAIMDGSTLNAGAIAGVRDIKNPIKAARAVMDSSKHLLLIGQGASLFAKNLGLEIVENSYFSTQSREEQHKKLLSGKENPDPRGTVGCVVRDLNGDLAAATSTGGMSGKRWGRVGDVPVIGAGTYANNSTVAVSGTGHGEYWIRRVVAYDISALVEYKGLSLDSAAHEVIFNKIDPMGGSGGGIIAVDKDGELSLVFNTDLMHRAWASYKGDKWVGVLKNKQREVK